MTTERLVSAEDAVQLVAAHPRVGQVAESVYIGRQPASSGEGQVVDLTAVWEGAAQLAEDPSVRCVVLERNPNRVDLKNAVSLRIGQDLGTPLGIRTSEIVYRGGVAEGGEPALAQTILRNIARALIKV